MTSPAIVGLNTILVRLCHPTEGLGGLLTKMFLARWLNYTLFHAISAAYVLQTFSRYMNISFVFQIINCLIF